MSAVAIIDYGMGNHRSVQKAIEKVGSSAIITSDAAEIAQAKHVILPGVGAFRDAIHALERHELIEPIRQAAASGKPFLGICLGLQLLLDLSFEDGEFSGLSIVPGKVRRFDIAADLKIPHMGWNQLIRVQESIPILQDIAQDAWFYFVHSYYVDPEVADWTAATTDYGGEFCSVVRQGNVFATQFHPEKSQSAGLQLLKNFVNL